MEIEVSYVGEAIAGCVYLFVGARLLLRSLRTRGMPEALIAASFLLWMLSYALYDIPYLLADPGELIPAAYSYGSLVALAAGNVVFAFFIRAVFRPGAPWATWLVAAVAFSNVAGLVGTAWIGDWEGTSALTSSGYWLEFFGSFAPTIWMAAEGLSQYTKSRSQQRLGLCEPMICNRFLLWGIAGSLWVTLEIVVSIADFVYALTGQWPLALDVAIGVLELVPIAIIWFVFFPPAFYCRWIEGDDSDQTDTEPAAPSLES